MEGTIGKGLSKAKGLSEEGEKVDVECGECGEGKKRASSSDVRSLFWCGNQKKRTVTLIECFCRNALDTPSTKRKCPARQYREWRSIMRL